MTLPGAAATSPPDGMPLVSVVVPTYNRRKELEVTLQSLRDQTYPNYEVFVCDDCSPDDTYEFLQQLQKSWPKLHIFRNEKNLNFNGTLQRLFALAPGELIGMQHDHDIYKPDFLSRMVALLQSHPSAGFACAAYDLLDEHGKLTLAPPLPECSIFENGLLKGAALIKTLANSRYTPVAAMSIVFRKNILEKAGGYRTDWYLASDEDLYRRMASISDVAFCPDPIFVMRLRPMDRQKILGSWKSIYNLFLFRTSVAESLSETAGGSRSRSIRKQFYFKWRALLEEALSLWLRGESAQIRQATNTAVLPALPSARAPLDRIERPILALFTALLAVTVRLGPIINRVRKRARA